jgi:dolichol-phosphate mannosyltransferase
MSQNDPVATASPPPLLSVIVPVYNEEQTVEQLLRRVCELTDGDREVLVVDDGSHDRTADLLRAWDGRAGVRVLRHAQNQGKGAAIRTGLAQARGEIVLIQDADLEYDPADLAPLVEVLRRGDSEVVYGSRYLKPSQPLPWTKFRLAVCLLNGLVRLLYGRRLTDEATCYKAFRTRLLRELDVQAARFDFCPEVTAKICRLGLPIVEVPISYRPRTQAQGKKLSWKDGWQAVWTLLKWRWVRWPRQILGDRLGQRTSISRRCARGGPKLTYLARCTSRTPGAAIVDRQAPGS